MATAIVDPVITAKWKQSNAHLAMNILGQHDLGLFVLQNTLSNSLKLQDSIEIDSITAVLTEHRLCYSKWQLTSIHHSPKHSLD